MASGSVVRIIASGSNNGKNYVRFSDGTQICYGKATAGAGVTYIDVYYPVSFLTGTAPDIFGWGGLAFKTFRCPNSQPDHAVLVEQSGAASEAYDFGFFAIGKWK